MDRRLNREGDDSGKVDKEALWWQEGRRGLAGLSQSDFDSDSGSAASENGSGSRWLDVGNEGVRQELKNTNVIKKVGGGPRKLEYKEW